MSQRCQVCGKGPQYGHAVSFSKRATNRRFMPNLSKRKVIVNGVEQRLMICTNCLRTLNKTKKGRFATAIEKPV
jgi:large subunit ribosomal protein L28